MAKDRKRRTHRTRPCRFCQEGVEYIDYKDLGTLKAHLNERGKIKASRTTGACPQHQRLLAAAIKNAREMALLPYSVR